MIDPGHDLDYLAISGLLALLGPAGARPVPPGLQVADLAGGTRAGLEIVAALFRRERTGEGAVLDVAILDAMVAWLEPLGAGAATAGIVPGPLAGTFPCYAVYPAADGAFMALGALEPPFWVAFCLAVDREDLVARQYDPTAMPEVAAILASRPRAAWLADLDADACIVPVNTPAEAQRDPPRSGPAGARPTLARPDGCAADDRPAPGLGARHARGAGGRGLQRRRGSRARGRRHRRRPGNRARRRPVRRGSDPFSPTWRSAGGDRPRSCPAAARPAPFATRPRPRRSRGR